MGMTSDSNSRDIFHVVVLLCQEISENALATVLKPIARMGPGSR